MRRDGLYSYSEGDQVFNFTIAPALLGVQSG